MLNLRPPVKTDEQLKALAASGARGIAPRAKAELEARKVAALRQAAKSAFVHAALEGAVRR